MIKKIKNILFKINYYDDLFIEKEAKRKEIDTLNIYIQHLEVNLRESQRDLKELKNDLNILKTKINNIELPKNTIKDLESKLLLADSYTLKLIIDFLVLDTYELVKNIASRVDRENLSEYIAYRDGAIWRNQELKNLLSKFVNKNNTFVDRITLEEESKKKGTSD